MISLEEKVGLFLIQKKTVTDRQQANLQKVYSKRSRDRDRESIAEMYPLMKFCISGYSFTVQRRKKNHSNHSVIKHGNLELLIVFFYTYEIMKIQFLTSSVTW